MSQTSFNQGDAKDSLLDLFRHHGPGKIGPIAVMPIVRTASSPF